MIVLNEEDEDAEFSEEEESKEESSIFTSIRPQNVIIIAEDQLINI